MFTKSYFFALVFVSSLVVSIDAVAQGDTRLDDVLKGNNEDQILALTDVLMFDGYLCEAERLVDNLLSREADNPYYNYLKGYIVLRYYKDKKLAKTYLQKSVDKTEGRLDLLDKNTDVTNDAFFHLATCYQYLQDFDRAEKYYTLFHQKSKKSSYFYSVSLVRIEQCKLARELLNNPGKEQVELLQGDINTIYPEYSPVISASGKELYYTSRRTWEGLDMTEYLSPEDNTYPEDVFLSRMMPGNTWGNSEILPLCEPYKNEASVSLSSDMNRLFVYSDTLGNGDIFATVYTDDHFASMSELNYKKMNTKYWETHYVVSQDSSNIIFSSLRKGGKGGRDLWIIERADDGTWSKPKNLEVLNTEQDEDSPFLTLDGKTLYYSSNGPQSIGGFDILKSALVDEGTWSKGENLGVPINSMGDDIFYTITSDGKDAYFSSFREGGVGEMDVYHVSYKNEEKGANVQTLEGGVINITDDAKQIQLAAKLYNETQKVEVPLIIKNNDYFNVLEDCQEYTLTYTNLLNGEVLLSEKIKTNCDRVPLYLEKYYLNGQYYVSGNLTALGDGSPVSSAKVILKDKITGEESESLNSGINGEFRSESFTALRPGDSLNLVLHIEAEGFQSAAFDLDTLLAAKSEIRVDYTLLREDPLGKVSDELASHIVYFDFDKSGIRNSEEEALASVMKLMEDNPSVKIKIRTYTDCRGSADYNSRLADRRAKSVLKYMHKRMKDDSRVILDPRGEENSVSNCKCEKTSKGCDDQQHQKDRRATFELVRD